MSASASDPLLLALDTGSPVVSVAVGRAGEVAAERSLRLTRSSGEVLPMVRETLVEAGIRLADLGGLIGLQGPGSFTGLRVGLATLLGLHQALGLPATALPTLEVLALAAQGNEPRVVAAVDALRNEWFSQAFRREPDLRAEGPARILPREELTAGLPCRVIGFGITSLAPLLGGSREVVLQEPPPLAATALRAAASGPLAWDSSRLIGPLYLRSPATTPNGRP